MLLHSFYLYSLILGVFSSCYCCWRLFEGFILSLFLYSFVSCICSAFLMVCDAIYFNKIIFLLFQKNNNNTGQGWPVSPGARIGSGSSPIFPAHIQTGLFSPVLKSPLPDRARPPILTALLVP